MAELVLDFADIALWSDVEATRVRLERVQAYAEAEDAEKAFVRFEGDTYPTGFAGEGKAPKFQMTARFMSGEHATLAALRALFAAADEDADGRLLLRTDLGEVGELNTAVAVMVTDVQQTPAGAGVIDLSWVAHVVEFTLDA